MIGTYGNYSHDDNEIWLHNISFKQQYSSVGQPTVRVARFTIRGVKTAATVSALTIALNSLKNAYSFDGYDFTLQDNSSNLTTHVLRSNLSVNGNRIVDFSFLTGTVSVGGSFGSGSEYTVRRTFQIVIEGQLLNGGAEFTQFRESLRLIGDGGHRFKMVGSLTGGVQVQVLQQFTPYRVVQSGFAVGFLDYPTAPAPIWPGALHGDVKVEEIMTPQFGSSINTNFPIRWRYEFESASVLSGSPAFI
jgi:hypothetical protein